MTRDTWTGDSNQPISYNAWLYGYANPINLSDSTGMSPECAEVRGSGDYIKCERIIRGYNPDSGPSLTELWLDDHDKCIGSQFLAAYRNLPLPGSNEESWGYWFHYLLNEQSRRTRGYGVSLDKAIAIALSGESNVGSFLYSKVKEPMARAMIIKGRARGMYVALGSRQMVKDFLTRILFFNGQFSITERNKRYCESEGTGHCNYFADFIQTYTTPVLNQDMLTVVEAAFRKNSTTPSDPNDAPDDWGNATENTLKLPRYASGYPTMVEALWTCPEKVDTKNVVI